MPQDLYAGRWVVIAPLARVISAALSRFASSKPLSVASPGRGPRGRLPAGTVGLSAGLTDSGLNTVIKNMFIFLMWLGRLEVSPCWPSCGR